MYIDLHTAEGLARQCIFILVGREGGILPGSFPCVGYFSVSTNKAFWKCFIIFESYWVSNC